jgi:hypothetical protein
MASPFTAFARNAFRNLALFAVVISATTLAQLNLATAQDKSAEVEVLFGTSGKLDKFRGYKEEAIGKGWKVDGDAIHFDGSGGGDLVTRDEYRNFELNFEWKVDKGANSGVMYRVSLGDPAGPDPKWVMAPGGEFWTLDIRRLRQAKAMDGRLGAGGGF